MYIHIFLLISFYFSVILVAIFVQETLKKKNVTISYEKLFRILLLLLIIIII